MEVWRDIPNFPGYQVSDLGRILGLRGKIMRLKTKRDKILAVGLYIYDGEKRHQKWVYVGRMVLIAFIGRHPTKKILRHVNGNPQDNRLKNLAWSTFPDNASAAVKRGTMKSGEETEMAKLTHDRVKEIRRLYKLEGENHLSMEVLAATYKVHRSTISRILHWRGWKNPPV